MSFPNLKYLNVTVPSSAELLHLNIFLLLYEVQAAEYDIRCLILYFF